MRKRVPRYWGPFEPIDDDELRVPHRRRQPRLAGARITMLGVDFEVHEPPELVAHLVALGERLGRLR